MEKKSKTKPSTNGEERKEDKSKGSFKERRLECIKKFSEEAESMDYGTNKDGSKKEYFTVAARHNYFSKFFPEHRVETTIIEHLTKDNKIAVKTTLYIGSEPYSTGLAMEIIGSNFVNKTSALENCETSSLGRALANFGLHGSEFASAEELANAIKQQANGKDKEIPIEQMTTTTKLNALYSKWKKEQDEIQIRFTNQEKSINEKGGQYGKKDW
jgi:hypothetical protein